MQNIKCCRNCHFLANSSKEYNRDGSVVKTVTWNSKEREIGELHKSCTAECYHQVWSIGLAPTIRRTQEETIDKNRDDCFFFPIHEGMSFQAASLLQERDAQNSQLKRTNLYATIGLWIAGIGLLFSALVSILKYFK